MPLGCQVVHWPSALFFIKLEKLFLVVSTFEGITSESLSVISNVSTCALVVISGSSPHVKLPEELTDKSLSKVSVSILLFSISW